MEGYIKITFYLKGNDRISTTVDIESFCSKDENGRYLYTVEDQTYEFKTIDTLSKVIYEGIVASMDNYYEAKINGGTISNEHIETTFGFGDIIVPIEMITGVKVKTKIPEEYSNEDIVTVETDDEDASID